MLCARVTFTRNTRCTYIRRSSRSPITQSVFLSTSTPRMSVQQPAWTQPTRKTEIPVLKLYNSLTRSKVCADGLSLLRMVKLTHTTCLGGVRAKRWESCEVVQLRANGIRCVAYGAREVSRSFVRSGVCVLRWQATCRNYVTQDVLRRIVTDYFGYDVHFVMNITDIDDKVSVSSLPRRLD